MEEYTEQANSGKFWLSDDGESKDVVFLYQKPSDALRCDAHYIRGEGYVHCLDDDCPACANGISKRSKLFIPMYLPQENKFVFWDRNTTFYHQLVKDVFDACGGDPSMYVFKVVRHGEYKSRDTRYTITIINKNTMGFDKMLEATSKKFPEAYEDICKSLTAEEMRAAIKGDSGISDSNLDDMPAYKITPRGLEDDPAMPKESASVVKAEDIDF